MKNILEVKNLTVDFQNQRALEKISFSVKTGEIVAVIGPNGSGKTTLVRAILGLLPYKGLVKILGGQTKDAYGQVGYVPQKFSFDKTFPLMVEEFLRLFSESEPKIKAALLEVGMEKYRLSRLGDLSGGQLQRILLAQAIVNMPKILFLDEAFAGVDFTGTKGFYKLLDHLNTKHGVTIIFISHELNVVFQHATKVLCLNKTLVCDGPPREKITHEVLEKLYGTDISLHRH